MARLVPHAETTAANLARVLRPHTLPSTPWEPHQRAVAARRLLEELGVRCDESAVLHDLKGFLLSSPRGTELVVSRDLDDEERLEVYAHLVAHALLGPDGPELALAARFEYVPGRAPGERPPNELREEVLADAVARAILAGRLEAAPRLMYCRDLNLGAGGSRARSCAVCTGQPGAVSTLAELPAAALAARRHGTDRARPSFLGSAA